MAKKTSRTTRGRQQASWLKPKSLVTIALIAFVSISIITLVMNERSSKSAASDTQTNSAVSTVEDRVVVYYFHGNARCVTCRTIESYAREAVATVFPAQLSDGSVEFQVINVETPSTYHFIEDYQLYAPSVVVARFENDTQATWKNLDKVWRLTGNKDAFVDYIRDEATAIMQGSG